MSSTRPPASERAGSWGVLSPTSWRRPLRGHHDTRVPRYLLFPEGGALAGRDHVRSQCHRGCFSPFFPPGSLCLFEGFYLTWGDPLGCRKDGEVKPASIMLPHLENGRRCPALTRPARTAHAFGFHVARAVETWLMAREGRKPTGKEGDPGSRGPPGAWETPGSPRKRGGKTLGAPLLYVSTPSPEEHKRRSPSQAWPDRKSPPLPPCCPRKPPDGLCLRRG